MAKHTPEPWQRGCFAMIHDCSGPEPIYSPTIACVNGFFDRNGRPREQVEAAAEANAERIVACVNVLEGVSTEDLVRLERGSLARMLRSHLAVCEALGEAAKDLEALGYETGTLRRALALARGEEGQGDG